jgi:twitching motility two-component system response regulator PilG
MEKQNHLQILEKFSFFNPNAWIELEYNSIIYNFYFKERKIIYASHSAVRSERLDRQLKRLSHLDKSIDKRLRNQVHLQFKELTSNSASVPSEYLVIEWLVNNSLIHQKTANLLLNSLIKELWESYLLIPNLTEDNLRAKKHQLTLISDFDIQLIEEETQKNIQKWKELSDYIKSPYQRPYLFKIDRENKRISLENQKKLANIFKGFNFLQLEAILNQDKLLIAQKIYPLIVNKTVILRDPSVPFDKFPNFENLLNDGANNSVSNISKDSDKEITLSGISIPNYPEKQYTIVCVDDSPIILKSITKFLKLENLNIIPINNAAKALIMITKVKPDLILMDIGMPNIDGYQLCSLIRKHSIFKETPIIMVTGNKGIINRAKAKFSGATDYMTKPFTQEDLLAMVFRYLND